MSTKQCAARGFRDRMLSFLRCYTNVLGDTMMEHDLCHPICCALFALKKRLADPLIQIYQLPSSALVLAGAETFHSLSSYGYPTGWRISTESTDVHHEDDTRADLATFLRSLDEAETSTIRYNLVSPNSSHKHLHPHGLGSFHTFWYPPRRSWCLGETSPSLK